MVIQRLLLNSFTFLFGKGRGGHRLPGKGREWWSWSYRAFFAKALFLFCDKEGVVVIVIHSLLLKGYPPLLGNGRGGSPFPSSSSSSSSSSQSPSPIPSHAHHHPHHPYPHTHHRHCPHSQHHHPPLLGKGRAGGHGHTEPSSEKLSSPFWEREVVVVMVIHS